VAVAAAATVAVEFTILGNDAPPHHLILKVNVFLLADTQQEFADLVTIPATTNWENIVHDRI